MPVAETIIPNLPVLSVGSAVDLYCRALDNLPIAEGSDVADRVLAVLLAREALARALSVSITLEPALLRTVGDLDQQLEARAAELAELIGQETLERWREALPPPIAWWWSLDQRAAAQALQVNPLWGIAAGLCVAVSLSLSTEIAQRFFSTTPDWLGIFGTITQVLLPLLAGGALTQLGWKAITRRLDRFGITGARQHRWNLGFALAVLVIVGLVRLALPVFAKHYNNRGLALHQQGQVSSALANYLRAVSLVPDYAQARYNLATAYEDVLEYDKALGEYQRAVEADHKFYPAYNNLARLYISRQQEYGSALALLNRVIEGDQFSNVPDNVRYSLLKNRGWAYFGMQLYDLAAIDLREALVLRPDGASAYCLLAQVLEAQQNPAAARSAWEQCLAYERLEFVEPEWQALARSRLMSEGTSP